MWKGRVNNSPMEIGNIRIDGIDVQAVEKLRLDASVNQHAKLEMVCLIKKEQIQECIMLPQRESIVSVWEQNTKLFSGTVTEAVCKTKKDSTKLYMTLLNGSYLLDKEKKSKSYQDAAMTYQEIAQDKALTIYEGTHKSIDHIIIQYEETDWEFLKRLASITHTGVYADMCQPKCVLYWGIADTEPVDTATITEYSIEKDIDHYKEYEKNIDENYTMADSIVYEFESTELFSIGDTVMVGTQKVHIVEMHCEMEKAEFRGIYRAKTKAGICYLPKLRFDMPGTAIEGKIIDVSEDKVRVHLSIDETQDKDKAYWLPFSAMEASSDGSGWYYMPEIGDKVKVCIPSWEETDAFAVSAVSTYENADSVTDLMADTNVKYMRNPSGKQVKLTPNQIQADAGGDKALFTMDNEGNITLHAKQMITMSATGMIELVAGDTLDICASKMINVKADMTGEIMMNEEGELQHLGGHVNINSEE